MPDPVRLSCAPMMTMTMMMMMMMMMMLCRSVRSSLVVRHEHDVSPIGRLLRAHELVDGQVGGDRRTLEMSEDDDAHQIPSTHARTHSLHATIPS